MTNMVDRYGRRPKSLEQLCLAEYVSYYDMRKERVKKRDLDENFCDDDFSEDEDESDAKIGL